jgi:hypothetical protein
MGTCCIDIKEETALNLVNSINISFYTPYSILLILDTPLIS